MKNILVKTEPEITIRINRYRVFFCDNLAKMLINFTLNQIYREIFKMIQRDFFKVSKVGLNLACIYFYF